MGWLQDGLFQPDWLGRSFPSQTEAQPPLALCLAPAHTETKPWPTGSLSSRLWGLALEHLDLTSRAGPEGSIGQAACTSLQSHRPMMVAAQDLHQLGVGGLAKIFKSSVP